MEKRRAKILEKMKGKILFEMGNDGEPTWRKIEVLDKESINSISFHAHRGEYKLLPDDILSGKKNRSSKLIRVFDLQKSSMDGFERKTLRI